MIDDHELSWELYLNALTSDYADVQGGTTGEGIHAGVMAGTVLIALQSYAGLDLRGDSVKINPNFPEHWRSVKFSFEFRDSVYYIQVDKKNVTIYFESDVADKVKVEMKGHVMEVKRGERKKI